MTSQKRFALVVAITTLVAAWSATSHAQIRGPYPYPYPYPPARYEVDPNAAIRLEVRPKEAEVYVDGYYAGIADDYDGLFKRLRLGPGQHEVTLFRDGYRTVKQQVYLTPDNTIKLKYRMTRLKDGEVTEARPVPPPPAAPLPQPQFQARRSPQREPGRGVPPYLPPPGPPVPQTPPAGPPGRPDGPPLPVPPMPPPTAGAPKGPPAGQPVPPPEPSPEQAGRSDRPAAQASMGTLVVRLQPGDVEMLVDGQPWPIQPGQTQVTIDASEGRHTIQVRKQGYIGYLTEALIRRGEVTTISIVLRPQG